MARVALVGIIYLGHQQGTNQTSQDYMHRKHASLIAALILAASAQPSLSYSESTDNESTDNKPTVLFGGIQQTQLRGRTLWLQPQQGKIDPLTQTTVLELVQRGLPEQPRKQPVLREQTALRDQPMLQGQLTTVTELPPFVMPPLLPLPNPPLSPLLDPRKMSAEISAFDEKCRLALAHMRADLANVERDADTAVTELHDRSKPALDRIESESAQQQMTLEESREKLERMKEHSLETMTEVEARILAEQEAKKHLEDKKEKVSDGGDITSDTEVHGAIKPKSEFKITDEKGTTTVVAADLREKKSAANPDSAIVWDPWYAGIAEAVKPPLVAAINRRGSIEGANTVRITVWNDLRIQIEIEEKGNPEFDEAVVEAYRSLQFNRILEFPKGSKRRVVTYLSDHKHRRRGEVVHIEARKLTGDVER